VDVYVFQMRPLVSDWLGDKVIFDLSNQQYIPVSDVVYGLIYSVSATRLHISFVSGYYIQEAIYMVFNYHHSPKV